MPKKVQYEDYAVVIYDRRYKDAGDPKKVETKHGAKVGPLTLDHAKELLGWTDEADGKEEFKNVFAFRDVNGHKIRLANNEKNRPFRRGLAMTYATENLRNKWRQNGETIAFDVRGDLVSGQHRLVGMIFAEQMRAKNPSYWKEDYGTSVIRMDCTVYLGIDDSKDVADTTDIGQKRSLGDVLFRNREFEDATEKEQQGLANILAGAVRLVWIRCGGLQVSDAKKFPHSEALQFMEQHPGILDAVKFIKNEDGGKESAGLIKNQVSLAYAAAMCYLMTVCKTVTAKFDKEGTPALDFSMKDQAEKFWTLLANGIGLEKGSPILTLKHCLAGMEAGGALARDEITGLISAAWNYFIDDKIDDKKDVATKDIKPKISKNTAGKKCILIADMPRVGGIDVVREKVTVEEVAGKDEGAATGKGKKKAPKGAKSEFAVGEKINVSPSPNNKEPFEAYSGMVHSIGKNGYIEVLADADGEIYGCETKEDIVTKAA